jgi:5'-3' exonuclease
MKELYKKLLNEVEDEHKTNHLRVRNSRVLIIDGLNTFIRSWTTNPAMNDDGDHIGGVTGTLNSIGFQIRMFNPTRVIVTFDGKDGSSQRKKIFEGYKSERGKNRFRVNRQYPEMMTEEDETVSMKRQFIWLVDILHHLPVTTMVYDGIEADDVIAYIATELIKEDEECVIASTDKDFLQLVNDRVTVFSSTKKKLYKREDVFNEWGLWPQNLLLFRTLDGDNSDNVPGVPGVGLKTFLKKFPEFTDDRHIDFDELFFLSQERANPKNGKLFNTILENRDTIERNRKIMDLSKPFITVHDRMKILDRYNDTDKKFQRFDFLQVAIKYKLMHSWKDINSWITSTWTNIITD